jgi:DNA-binding PadR family transcriptional regulator
VILPIPLADGISSGSNPGYARPSDSVPAVPRPQLPELSLNEWAVLALVAEKAAHGFAIAKQLSPEGDLGRIWTVPRPIVYRALTRLEEQNLVEPLELEPGDGGPVRTPMRPTRTGKAAVDRWLATPARHVRELRTQLLLQLLFLDRRGLDLSPLASAQLDQLRPILVSLHEQAHTTSGFARLLAQWRYDSAQAATRVLEGIVADSRTRVPDATGRPRA